MMEKEILEVFRYFSLFSYAPTSDELYVFLKKRASKGKIKAVLVSMAKKAQLKRISEAGGPSRYTLGEYSIKIKDQDSKIKISQAKINKIDRYINLLARFTQIKLIGLSGTVAMLNAEEDDDIDLFIITARNRLFTGRFIALVLAQILGLRRIRDSARKFSHTRVSPRRYRGPLESEKISAASSPKYKDKICLNLFFDETNLRVPKAKETEYVAHEILQMKPLVVKDDVYMRFLEANRWVFKIFPNGILKLNSQKSIRQLADKSQNWLGNVVETLLKVLQLYFIRKHRTKEIITSSQLWFHPRDFGERM